MKPQTVIRKHGGSSFAMLLLAGGIALMSVSLPACEGTRNFSLLGYSSKPMYNDNIHTVYVPIFKNNTYRDTIRRGLEFDLTQAVVREIEAKTPYKVVSDRDCADTELLGTITMLNKSVITINQNNEVRQAETTMSVEVLWRDLRTGEILSGPPRKPDGPPRMTPGVPAPTLQASDGATPVPIPVPDAPPGTLLSEAEAAGPAPNAKPVLVQSIASYIPELGQSTTTALRGNVDRIATQIVSMMEAPW